MGKWVSITISKENYDTLTKIKEELNLASLNEALTHLIEVRNKTKAILEEMLKGDLMKALFIMVDVLKDMGIDSLLYPAKAKVEKVL